MSSPDEIQRAYAKGYAHAMNKTKCILIAAFRDQWDLKKIDRRINRISTKRAVEREAKEYAQAIQARGARHVHR